MKVSKSNWGAKIVLPVMVIFVNVFLLYSNAPFGLYIVLTILFNTVFILVIRLNWVPSIELNKNEIVIKRFGVTKKFDVSELRVIGTANYGFKTIFSRSQTLITLEFDLYTVDYLPNKNFTATFIDSILKINPSIKVDAIAY